MDVLEEVIGGWGEAFTHHSTLGSCYRASSTLVVLEHHSRTRHSSHPASCQASRITSVHCVIRTPGLGAASTHSRLIPIQTRVLHVSLTRMDAGALGAIPAKGIQPGRVTRGDSAGATPPGARCRRLTRRFTRAHTEPLPVSPPDGGLWRYHPGLFDAT